MKKFTKGCLITALVLFITGCVFCAAFGVTGGFRQIDAMNGNRSFKILRFGNLGNYVLGYNGSWLGIWDEDDWYEDWEYWEDRDEEEWTEMAYELAAVGTGEQTNYNVNDISNIDIELGGENLIIEESEDDYIWVGNNSGHNRIKYVKEGRTFKLYSRQSVRLWKNVSRGSVYLYLPKGMTLDSIDLEVGAGKFNSIALEADEISLDIGAGTFTIEGMSAREVDISIGAGKADIYSMNATDAEISVGAGSINLNEIDVRDISLEAGMGSISAEGKVSGDADIECGMGSISMILDGSEKEHDYYIDCAMGAVQIGGNRYSGLASERRIDNGSSSTFSVDCSMGSINIEFN